MAKKNNLFNMLKNGLRDAEKDKPNEDLLAMGFTNIQMKKMDLKRPRLIWYDSETEKYYDQGDSTFIKKSDYTKINKNTFKKDRPMDNLKYYVIINQRVVDESNKPLNN